MQKNLGVRPNGRCLDLEDSTLMNYWWHMSIIPALGRQEDHEFKASLSYTVRLCLKMK
jgi:hypothetical protein